MPLLDELRERFDFGPRRGRGSYGQVFEVRDRRSGATYALKHFSVPEDGERERREVASTLRMKHPNLIRCFEGAVSGGEGYLLMELAEGTLAGVLRDPAQRGLAWRALRQVGEGLVALHAAGLVHRDLKPANVLFVDGVAKLADLGLTRDENLETMTQEGMILGTPEYLSPEQALGRRVTPASDLYALGVLYYECLTGELPYSGRTPLELLHEVAAGPLRPLPAGVDLAPETRAHLERLRAMDPEERPADLARWLRELDGLEHPTGEGEGPPIEPTVRLSRGAFGGAHRGGASTGRRPRRAATRGWRAGAAALVLGAVVAGFLMPDRRPEAEGPGGEAEPTPASSPFRVEDLQATRERLTDLQAQVVLPGGELVDPDDPRAAGGHPFPDADPVAWGHLERALPGVARFRRWAARSGDPRALPEPVLQEMRKTDSYLESLGLPQLHEPIVSATPVAPGDELRAHLRIQLGVEIPDRPSWIGRVGRDYIAVEHGFQRLGFEMYSKPPKPILAGADLSFLHTWRRFQDPKAPKCSGYLESYTTARSARLAIQPYLREFSARLRRVAQALRLAGRQADTSHADTLAVVAGWLGEASHAALFAEALTDPLVIPEEGDQEASRGLPEEFVAELCLQRSRIWVSIGDGGLAKRDRARGLRLYQDILAAPVPPPGMGRRRRVFSIGRRVYWTQAEDHLEVVEFLRRHLPTLEEYPGELRILLWRVLRTLDVEDASPEQARPAIALTEELLPGLESRRGLGPRWPENVEILRRQLSATRRLLPEP